MEQFHLRSDDAELILSIKYEQSRAGLSKSGAVELLLRAGVEQMRWRREQEAIMVYTSAQLLSTAEQEVEQE